MSKETDQELAMLEIFYRILTTLRDTHAFSRIDIKRSIKIGIETCQKAAGRGSWPGMRNWGWIEQKRDEFIKFAGTQADHKFSSRTLVCMLESIISEMYRIADGSVLKVPIIERLSLVSGRLHDFCDEKGLHFEAYENSGEMLDELYRIIELKEFA